MENGIEEAIERLEYIDRAYSCNNYYSVWDLKCIEILLSDYKRVLKENEELSYIISEIEQYTLDEQINEESIYYNEFIEVQNMAFDRVYNKLQELLNKGE